MINESPLDGLMDTVQQLEFLHYPVVERLSW